MWERTTSGTELSTCYSLKTLLIERWLPPWEVYRWRRWNSSFTLMLRWARSRRALSERSFAPILSYIIVSILWAILNSF